MFPQNTNILENLSPGAMVLTGLGALGYNVGPHSCHGAAQPIQKHDTIKFLRNGILDTEFVLQKWEQP
jgi:hypothetical protein